MEFYKFFFKDIKKYLVESLNFGYQQGELSSEQKWGVITLLPKPGVLERITSLKNWRPISLLNMDYKFATKTIAAKIKKQLLNLMYPDQTGFLKRRYIGENIRQILDAIETYEKWKEPGLIVNVDFDKAFDSIEWSYIISYMFKLLKYLNFGSSFVKWIKTFYSNITSCVLNNDYTSNYLL